MTWEAWVTLGIVLIMIVSMVRGVARPDVIMLVTLAAMMGMSYFSSSFPLPEQLIRGFGNEGLITIAMLFVVVTGLTQTHAMTMVTQPLLGRPASVLRAQLRLLPPVAIMSAFMNNTPIVAVFMPVVSDWCKKTRISPSKLFIPLSFATVLGGLCTLIGTSTNLVVHGLLTSSGVKGFGMFDLAWVGIPAAIVGLTYLLLASPKLLPDRQGTVGPMTDPREYTVEMIVQPGSTLVGQSIEQAGLRHLPGMYLVEIDREGQVLPAVSSYERLHAHDRLVFVGIVESVVDLQKIRGLVPATDQVFKLELDRSERCMVEAVVSNTCPLVGKTIREGRFRSRYDAAVLAVARSGERLRMKIGDIKLEAGDTLMLETHPAFVERQRNSRDFFLVSKIENAAPPRHERAYVALTILVAMVIAMSTGLLSPLASASVAAALMIVTRCCNSTEIRQAIDWEVLLVIGAALGIAQVISATGAATGVADGMVSLAQGQPLMILIVLYVVTMVFTELLTNNAAAALMFPIAWATATSLNLNPMPFVVAMTIAASCGFATPLGYTTHLMVFGPGGYKFSDYLRIGIPLNLLVMAVTVTVAPMVWPFELPV